jgi:hypothetical protein
MKNTIKTRQKTKNKINVRSGCRLTFFIRHFSAFFPKKVLKKSKISRFLMHFCVRISIKLLNIRFPIEKLKKKSGKNDRKAIKRREKKKKKWKLQR